MTREHKLALIVGFSLILLVGVLISDHLSRARQAKIASVGTGEAGAVVVPPAAGDPMKPLNDALAAEPAKSLAAGSAPAEPSHLEPRKGAEPTPLTIAQGASRSQPESPDSALDKAINEQGGSLVQRQDGGWDIRVTAAQQTTTESTGIAAPGGIMANNTARTSPLPDFEHEKPVNPGTAKSVTEQVKYHAVKKGETMFQIAADYYGTGKIWRELAKFNGVESKEGAVRVGMKLRIPAKDVLLGKATPSKATVEAPAAPASKPLPGKRQEGTPVKPRIELATYTVKKGDTLGDISKKTLGTSRRWQEFVELNKIQDEDHIPAGTILKVPVMRG